MVDNKVLIFKRDNQLLTALMQDRTLLEVHVNDEKNTSLIGNIYVGRVQNIVKNIEAAFVEISKGLVCYLPLNDLKNPVFTNRLGVNSSFPDRPLCIGDELIVQVTRDALKTKQPAVTTNFSIPGEFVVLNHGGNGLGVSSKITSELREKLKSFVLTKYVRLAEDLGYGVVLRTNTSVLIEEEFYKITSELENVTQIYDQIISVATHRPAFTKLYSKPNSYGLDQFYQGSYEEIVTDQKDIYDELIILHQEKKIDVPIRLYQDEQLSLINLYSLESRLKEALETRIWLKSGGYLVIEPTEALTVIDVNSGKFDAKSNTFEETILKINLEAAIEAEHQIRLRNLSGIIIVDFINMKADKDIQKLLSVFKNETAKDPIQTNVVGMTSLGLVEVTRKKKNKTLKELLERI
ncbi:MAG: ribonuclease E/G [Lachnospiraceae bacterium]|nr:ribonuclease E/G [Lachnospiraceae bacterium]